MSKDFEISEEAAMEIVSQAGEQVVHGFMPGQRIIVDGMDITDDVIAELREMEKADVVIAEREQAEIARLAGQEVRALSFGEQTMQITPEAYDYWGQRLGYDCWADKQFRREFARDNPAVRVRALTGNIVSGYGSKAQLAPSKFEVRRTK